MMDRLRAGFRRASAEVNKFTDRVRNRFNRVSRAVFSLRGAVAAFTGAAVVAGLTRIVTKVADTADQIGKLSQRLGLSTEFLSEFRHVAEQTGVDSNTLDLALQRVTRRFGEIARTGRGTALPALQELGTDLVQAVRRGESFEQLLPTIADRLNEVEDPAKRLSIAFQLFDSEGAKLVQTLGIGSDRIDELRREANGLGLTIDKEAAKSAADWNDEVAKLGKSLKGLADDIILPILPVLTDFAEDIRGVIANFRQLRTERNKLILSKAGKLPGKGGRLSGGGGFVDPFTGRPGQPTPPNLDGVTAVVDENGNITLVPGAIDPTAFVGPILPEGQKTDIVAKQQELAATTVTTNARLIEQRDRVDELNSSFRGARSAMEGLRVEFSAFNVARNAVLSLAASISGNLTESLIAFAEGTKTAKEAFRDLARAILRDLLRIIIQALIARALGVALGSPSGGETFQAAGGPAQSKVDFVTHGGLGPVPGGTGSFASGGFVPEGRHQRAILHGPELVVPLNRQFDVSSLGGGSSTTIYNINAIDVQDFDNKVTASMRRQDQTVAGIVENRRRNQQGFRTLGV